MSGKNAASGSADDQAPPAKNPSRPRRQRVGPILLALLSIVNLAMVGWVEIKDIEWPQRGFAIYAWIDLGMVLVFLVDFLRRARHARRERKLGSFLGQHWYEIVSLIPLFVEALPWFREAGALRILRVVRILRLLRALPAIRRFYESISFLQRVVSESHLLRLISIVAALIALASVGFWIVEPRTNVQDFDDAVWCAIGTFTTAGFVEPTTGAGRILATILMFLGMATGTAVATALVTTTLRLHDQEHPPCTLELLAELRRREILTPEKHDEAARRLLLGALETLRSEGVLSEEELKDSRRRCGQGVGAGSLES